MKMLKKLLVISLQLAIVLSLSGCNEANNNPQEVTPTNNVSQETISLNQKEILDIFTNASNQDYLNVNMVMHTSVTAEEMMSFESTTTSQMMMDASDKENMQFYSLSTTELMGGELVAETFYMDGYIYLETFGNKMKVQAVFDEVINLSEHQIAPVTEELLTNVTIKEESGNIVLTYENDSNEFFENLTSLGLFDSLDGFSDVDKIEINQLTGSYVLDANHNPVSQHLMLSVGTMIQEKATSVEINIDMTYLNFGEPFEVPVPEDIEEYIEY